MEKIDVLFKKSKFEGFWRINYYGEKKENHSKAFQLPKFRTIINHMVGVDSVTISLTGKNDFFEINPECSNS